MVLGSDFVDLTIFCVLEFLKFCFEVLDFVGQFLLLELGLNGESLSVVNDPLILVLEHFVIGFLFVQQLRYFFVLPD